ncbi:hypothetical protein [Spirosoma oryzicola]|uniref:hypothetical protein n=1 Tax=Spirosoma oryzicola TaxID=2898794 RepID=UPI001E4F57F9|nr:hypothetical protein [Spirosoma oryzicola]UHG93216.1 hypothetical protein LQ777_10025 [Spirosoma oryzicola]
MKSLSPEQLAQPVYVSPDDKPILQVGSFEVLQHDLIKTDEGLEPRSFYGQSEIEEQEYPTVYKTGTVFLNLQPL